MLSFNDLLILSREDQILFLSEVIDAINISIQNNNFKAINKCLEEWEATIEMLSIPGLKERVWEHFEKLIGDDLIKPVYLKPVPQLKHARIAIKAYLSDSKEGR